VAIFLIAWLIAALILAAIDVRARLTGQPRGRESLLIWGFVLSVMAWSAFWFTR